MPSKNVLKEYFPESYYHIYNCGLNDELIFRDLEDSRTFMEYLQVSLSLQPSPEELKTDVEIKGKTFKVTPRQVKNFNGNIHMIAFVLMPTHYHFLVKQRDANAIAEFMRSISTRYSMYFNKRHKRRGPVFASRYKGAHLSSDEQIVHLTRYIHRNPVKDTQNLAEWYSSYGDYTGEKQTGWVEQQLGLDMFNRLQPSLGFDSYKAFVESEANSKEILGDLVFRRDV